MRCRLSHRARPDQIRRAGHRSVERYDASEREPVTSICRVTSSTRRGTRPCSTVDNDRPYRLVLWLVVRLAGVVSAPATGIAAFAVDRGGSRTFELESAPRLRAASVIKPLLFWAGAASESFAGDHASWTVLAEPGITTSDNEATAALWSRVGEEPLLAWLNERIGLSWHTDGDGEHPCLRVMVTADELARGYAALAADATDAALQVCRWMRGVRAEQTFGLKRVAAEALDVAEGVVAVKCGWFGGECAHAVVLVEDQERTVGSVVTTYRPADEASRSAAQDASGDDGRLVALHDVLAGEPIRSAARRALIVAANL